MVYIQLATPIKDFGRVRIKEISFFDTNGEENVNKSLGFKYQVYRKDENKFISFYDRHISITDQNFINTSLNNKSETLGAYDSVCKMLLQYLVDSNIEVGTIEVE
jgi:hypothetical protein